MLGEDEEGEIRILFRRRLHVIPTAAAYVFYGVELDFFPRKLKFFREPEVWQNIEIEPAKKSGKLQLCLFFSD